MGTDRGRAGLQRGPLDAGVGQSCGTGEGAFLASALGLRPSAPLCELSLTSLSFRFSATDRAVSCFWICETASVIRSQIATLCHHRRAAKSLARATLSSRSNSAGTAENCQHQAGRARSSCRPMRRLSIGNGLKSDIRGRASRATSGRCRTSSRVQGKARG
jgi:hypothetical protein